MGSKRIILIVTTFLIVACHPFEKDRVLKYVPELNEIVDEVEEHVDEVLWFDSDDIPEMIDLDINYIVRNLDRKNKNYLGFIEENDSLIIFIQRSSSILDAEKRIIYDFAKVPRSFCSETIQNASYEITQLNDRWYFSTEGFD